LIRFQAEMQGRMILTQSIIRKNNITKKQIEFIEYLLDNRYTYPSCILDCGKEDTYDAVCNISADLEYKPLLKTNQR
jgi:hypothetical protein